MAVLVHSQICQPLHNGFEKGFHKMRSCLSVLHLYFCYINFQAQGVQMCF